jgi:UDP-glucuronate 4-epimerase
MKYLITGGAGFIGNALAINLHALGHQVVIVDNFNDYYDVKLKQARIARLPKDISVVHLNITDATALERLFAAEKFDAVCHLAAQAGVRYSLDHPAEYIENNYRGTFCVLEAMRKYSVNRLVFASTSSVYGEETAVPFAESASADRPVSMYAATKRAGELLAHTYHHLYGFSVTNLRFFTVYGPWGRPDMAIYTFTDKILRGEPITLYNKGKMWRDFTYIDDIIAGVTAALNQAAGYDIYNLGRGQCVSLEEFVRAIETATGKTARIHLAQMQPGDVSQTYADISAATRVLGYTPKTSVTEGVARYVAWFNTYYKQ